MSAPEPAGSGSAGSASTAVVDGVDIDAVAAAVQGCAGVDGLYSSPAASVASYLPGRQVAGIRVDDRTVTIQVRSRWSIPVADVARQIRAALASLVADRRVDVVIAAIADPPGEPPLALPAGPSATDPTPDSPRAPNPVNPAPAGQSPSPRALGVVATDW